MRARTLGETIHFIFVRLMAPVYIKSISHSSHFSPCFITIIGFQKSNVAVGFFLRTFPSITWEVLSLCWNILTISYGIPACILFISSPIFPSSIIPRIWGVDLVDWFLVPVAIVCIEWVSMTSILYLFFLSVNFERFLLSIFTICSCDCILCKFCCRSITLILYPFC